MERVRTIERMSLSGLTVYAVKLLGGINDLHRRNVLSFRNGMVHQANSSDDLTRRLEHCFGCVARVADNDGGGGRVFTATDASSLAVLHSDLVDLRVQHVRATVDCAKSRERLRQATNTINRIQERTLAISTL